MVEITQLSLEGSPAVSQTFERETCRRQRRYRCTPPKAPRQSDELGQGLAAQ